MPGSGDSVQALKAGIMEIPDVIAINKMDHPAAKTMLNEVRSIVAARRSPSGGPTILLTEALDGRERRRSSGRRSRSTARRSRATVGSRSAGGKNLAAEVFAVASSRAKRASPRRGGRRSGLQRVLARVEDASSIR